MNLSSGPGGRYSKRLERWTHVRICVCGHATPVTTEAIARFAMARHVCPPARAPRPAQVVDVVAVDRACGGGRLPLNRAERREVIRRLTEAGESARQIGDRLQVTRRTVERTRVRLREQVTV